MIKRGSRGPASRGPAGRGGPRDRDRDNRDRDRDRDREGGGRPRFFRKKICRFCSEKVSLIDYKDVERLSKFLTEKGKILGRRITGNCAKHQRALAHSIKRARHAALVPFQLE